MDLIIALLAIVGGIVAIIALEIVLDYAWFLVQRGWTHKRRDAITKRRSTSTVRSN